ncbi:hypothetical protein HU200_058912 [Digitaria exilis]|uniref:Uncharacterized protein n=1 Tax=Digitaria exilis TaxID=1010633 RepID=A0A835ABY2_9POAL|nr:hypothetical protein HU200_058912 [Digitaria exilis]
MFVEEVIELVELTPFDRRYGPPPDVASRPPLAIASPPPLMIVSTPPACDRFHGGLFSACITEDRVGTPAATFCMWIITPQDHLAGRRMPQNSIGSRERQSGAREGEAHTGISGGAVMANDGGKVEPNPCRWRADWSHGAGWPPSGASWAHLQLVGSSGDKDRKKKERTRLKQFKPVVEFEQEGQHRSIT